ncbi:MAG: T9SS type A sorting domain-containing protein [Bacteroidota bacterium]
MAQHWGSLGAGLDNGAYVIVYDSARNVLYGFGSYTSDTILLNYCGQWDGSNWAPLGSGINGIYDVNEACMYRGDLYVGGYFNSIGGITCNGIARWNGTQWLQVGIGLSAGVNSFTLLNNELYFASNFGPTPGFTGIAGYGIFKWDGNSIQVVDTTSRLRYRHLINFNDTLYSVSSLEDDTVLEDAVRKWTGIGWEKIGLDFNRDTASAYAVTVYNSQLYVAGVNSFNDKAALYKWDNTNWRKETPYLNGNIRALQEFNGKLYVAGLYDYAGTLYTRSIATWDGSQWSALADTGIFGDVYCLAKSNSLLYAGGNFGRAGNVSTKGITYYSLENLPPDNIITDDKYIVVYPSLAFDEIVIDISHTDTTAKTLNIYNTPGQIVFSNNISYNEEKIKVNISELAQGNYFVEIAGPDKKYYSKIIKR